MGTQYNLGIIGCGFIAEQHVRALKMIPEANVIGIAAPHKEISKAFKEKMGLKNCRCFLSYDELLAMKDLDFVSISLPNKFHREVLFAVADAGKHAICEKPVANNLKDVDEMIEIMDKKSLKFAVYHQSAFYPENLLIKELLEQEIFRTTRFAWNGAFAIGKWNWGKDTWRVDPSISGGGILMDEGVHLCHLLGIYFDHEKPMAVSASIDRLGKEWAPCEDTGVMLFEFPTGTAVATTGFLPLIGRKYNMKTYSQGIITEEGSIELIFSNGAEGIFSPVEKVLITTSKGVKEYSMPSYSGPLAKNVDSFKRLYLDFINCVNNDREPYVNGRSARDAMGMVMGSYESAALGKSVRLPMNKKSPVYREGVVGIKKLGSKICPYSILKRKKM